MKVYASACCYKHNSADPTKIGKIFFFLFTFSSLLADVEQSVKDAGEEAGKLKEEGFQAIKMFVGLLSINDDLQRVAAVRKAIGPKVFLSSENKRTLLLGGSYG